MIIRAFNRHAPLAARSLFPGCVRAAPARSLTAAPANGQGPFMQRRSDRELPDPEKARRSLYWTVPLFVLAVGGSMAAIFNYQKASSSIVSSTLYALRIHKEARELLGDEITFKQKFPWIRGEMNQLHGRIDVSYGVKGTKGDGIMRFKSTRHSRMGLFKTEIWDLTMSDGRKVALLDTADSLPQPDAS